MCIRDRYKDVKTVKAEIVKAAPKGNAAIELHEMIGLDNAKEVIENAVSFFKMQKLYAEKGIKADRPSMHMVFTAVSYTHLDVYKRQARGSRKAKDGRKNP